MMSLPAEKKMDPINSFLGRLLLEEITPVVMVLSTPLAEDACQKNGLNFVEMLLPFSLFNKIDVPVRTASDQPYRLQMFKLRLVYASDVHLPNYESAEEQLKKVVSDASDETLSDLRSDLTQPETALSESESYKLPLWVPTFNKELVRAVSFSEHEAFDHPVACLLVVSSKDQQPINRFVDLFNTNQLPSLLNEGAMDPKILKHYLLLHDNQDGTPEKAASILAEMRSTFGPTDSKLLCINSAQNVDDELKDNPWKIHALTRNDSPCFLNVDDLNGLREFMQDFSSKHIIPHMEQKIRILNQQVSATRKGFKNQIKNLWWRKGKEDAPETTNGPIYTFSSIESQIRVLGDYAFMLRDYELALSNYRLLSTDYKLDKVWMRYAGVQEMMGLSFFMLDQSRKEAEYCMETAFSTYLKIGSSAQRNATRCGLWWSEMLKARGQYKDAASVYVRISNEVPSLHAAVMLEQASHCYLMSNPPMLRKFGFHLVLAGVRYYLCDLRHHAIRTYRSALFVYKGNAWGYISDQVHFNIGRWYAFFGIFDVAVKHMLEVLACSHQPLATQDLFLREFFNIVQNMGTIFEVDNLPLPVMNMSSLNVIYEDHRTYASSANVGESESLWLSLEDEMVPSVSTMRSNWLDAKPKSFPLKKYNDFHVSVVGEAIQVKFEIKNPLQISISVSSFSLICELSAKSEATKFDESASDVGLQDDAEPREGRRCRNINNDISSLILSKLDFVLAGGETKMVELDVTPKLEGVLKLVGVRWTLSGSVVGYQYFDVDTKKKHRKGKREASRPAISNLNFIVIKGLPKLVGGIQDLPRKAYAGDLQLHMLQLRNESEYHVKNMKMKISHPRFLIPGSSEDLNKDFPSFLEKQVRPETEDVLPNVAEQSKGLLFSFPSDITIQGGTTFLWPLWLHTGISGKISLYISIYYEMESCSSDMSYRLLRMHYDLEVLPSMDVSFHITPCPLRLQEFLVRMDIINRANSECFYLQQLSCVCDQWEISLLPASVSAVPLQVVSSGQALSRFFKLKDCRRSLDHESKHGIKGSDILLGLQDNKEMLIDISRSPLTYFHQHERYHQGKSPEGDSDTVDFVLILKTRENESQLLSIHKCHCSFSSRSPISWLMDAPRMILHDFSDSFCEVSLHLTVRNCSEAAISLRIATFDTTPEMSTVPESSGSRGGWHDVDNVKGVSDVDDSRSISPVVWCASSSTRMNLEASCSAEIPLRICVFSPGTYDLSNYELHWKVEEGVASFMKRPSSGVERGHAFYLTVLQQPSP